MEHLEMTLSDCWYTLPWSWENALCGRLTEAGIEFGQLYED